MNTIELQFDLSSIDPYVGGSDPLPSGTYAMAIADMEVVANSKAESGHNLRIVYNVTEGELKGRKLYENLNLWHKTSDAAREVAWKQLSSIGHAVGVLQGTDLTQLANKPMMVEVSLEPGTEAKLDDNGREIKARGPSNRVVRRDPYSVNAAAATQPHLPQQNPVSQPNAAAAQAAPAFNPAAQQTAQATGTPGASTPPWLAK